MKVLIVGMIYSRNLGDGVIYLSLKSALESFNVEVSDLDIGGLSGFYLESKAESKVKIIKSFLTNRFPYIYRAATFLGISSNKKKFLLDAERKIQEVDAVIIGGGQILTNLTETLPNRLKAIADICNKYEKPYAIFGCGVGKTFTSKGSRNYKHLINSASYVAVRGRSSRRRLVELTGNKAIQLVMDPVFGLPYSPIPVVGEGGVGICYQDFLSMGMHSPIFNKLGKLGVEKIILNVIKAINATGKSCTIFTNGDLSDYSYAQEFFENNHRNANFTLESKPERPLELVNMINKYDYVISFRMHASIIAYAQGKKVINIIWDDKIEEVWEQANEAGVPTKVEQLQDPKLTFDLITEFINSSADVGNHRHEVKESIRNCLRGLDVRATHGFK